MRAKNVIFQLYFSDSISAVNLELFDNKLRSSERSKWLKKSNKTSISALMNVALSQK